MATLNYTNTFYNNTISDANKINVNFSEVSSVVNLLDQFNIKNNIDFVITSATLTNLYSNTGNISGKITRQLGVGENFVITKSGVNMFEITEAGVISL